jgi:hypothetical protein
MKQRCENCKQYVNTPLTCKNCVSEYVQQRLIERSELSKKHEEAEKRASAIILKQLADGEQDIIQYAQQNHRIKQLRKLLNNKANECSEMSIQLENMQKEIERRSELLQQMENLANSTSSDILLLKEKKMECEANLTRIDENRKKQLTQIMKTFKVERDSIMGIRAVDITILNNSQKMREVSIILGYICRVVSLISSKTNSVKASIC